MRAEKMFRIIATTTYLGSSMVIYAPTIAMETALIADVHSVYNRRLEISPSCFLAVRNTSDCPRKADEMAM